MTRAVVYLVTNNVPLNVAEKLNAVELEAWCINVGETKGAEFDWGLGCWKGEYGDDV